MVGTTQVRARLAVEVRPPEHASLSLAVTGLFATGVITLVSAGMSPHRPRRLLGNIAHLGWLAMGFWRPENALFSREELRVTMNAIALPANFRRTGQSAGWSRWQGEFTAYTRHWVAEGDAEQVQAQLREVLVSNRFTLGPWTADRIEAGTATALGVRGRYTMTVGVSTTGTGEDGARVELAPGLVGVTATLQKQNR